MGFAVARCALIAKRTIKYMVLKHTYTLNSFIIQSLRGAESVCMFHFDDKTQGFLTYLHFHELPKVSFLIKNIQFMFESLGFIFSDRVRVLEQTYTLRKVDVHSFSTKVESVDLTKTHHMHRVVTYYIYGQMAFL